MRKILWLFFNAFFFICNMQIIAQEITYIEVKEDTPEMKITILYDNYIFKEGARADWGFACLIESSNFTILFDTGANPDILLSNMNVLGVDIFEIDVIVISHNHWDHTGGLDAVLEKKSGLKVYMPFSTDQDEIKRLALSGADVLTEKQPKEILKNIYLTGEMGNEIKEQSLILNTPKGMIIVTGCSHPGIVDILKQAKKILDAKIYLVLGGFHLHKHTKEQVDSITDHFKSMDVEQCGCSHCTGENAIRQFRSEYAKNFIEMGTGKVLILNN